MRKMISVRILCALVAMQGLAACGGDKVVGALYDAGVDAPTRTGPYDECGNGMDDDGDGQIDEGCSCGGGEMQPCFTGMYPNRGVGACADGVQSCDATSTMEFGQWAACTMDTLPADEACDGIDNNCDGAIDEGCACTAGDTRVCASEFSTAPCSPGTQSCASDGTWSACEGAIGPSAEACGTGAGDGIDNDCDGETDEGCSCVPRPEVCGDGLDNDCDGTVDEDPCRTCVASPETCNGVDDDCDGMVDEGVCADASVPDGGTDGDAGMCMPEAETCDGVDQDCDGVIDNGACSACACERWTTTSHPLTLAERPRGTVRGRQVEVAFDGDDTVALLYEVAMMGVDPEVFLEIHRVDGSTVAARSLASVDSFIPSAVGTIAFGGDRFVATWNGGLPGTGLGTVHAVAVGRDGSTLVGPVQVADAGAHIGGVAMLGNEAYVVFFRGTTTYIQHLDASLNPVGAAIELPGISTADLFGIEVRTLDDAIVVVGQGAPGTTVRVAVVRASGLVGMSDLGLIATSTSERGVYRASAATDGSGGAMICYQLDGWTISCRRIDLADASPDGSAFDVVPITGPGVTNSRAWDVVAAGCAYQVVLGVATGSGPQSAFRGYEISADDSIRTFTMDRQWVQSNQSFAAFETNAGGLLRVLEDKMITVQSCGPALPEPDCEMLRADITELACGGCGGDPSVCSVRGGVIGRDYYTAIHCDRIDTVACRIAVDSPECSDGRWVTPADCALPP